MTASFVRLDACTFRATEHTSGAWDTADQHVAPAMGLLAHLVETDRDARRDDGLVLARLSYDVLGTMPVGEVTARVGVLRAGRTIELVEAALASGGRDALRLRAWLLLPRDTQPLAGSAHPHLPPPDALPVWNPTAVWRRSTSLGGYDPQRLRALKAEEAGDLYVSGSATLVRAMLADGLVDELHLYVYPVAVGTGLRLFPEGAPRTPLRLLRQDAMSNGVAHLVYGPA